MKLKLFSLMLLVACHSLMASIPQSEKQALLDFHQSTNGENWNTQWDLNKPVTTWFGVQIEKGNVVAILLMDNGLSGSLSGTIGNLTKLKVLDVAFNRIIGNIPTSISQLNRLEVLRLGKNKLTGEIPADIVNLGQLRILDVFGNDLVGKLPTGIENLSKMEVLSISDNRLSGELPEGIGQLENLKRLEMANNNFEGDIPESLSNLKRLKSLVFAENKFKGKFPSAILSLPNLKVVQLQNNDFDQIHLKKSLPVHSGVALLNYEDESKFSRGNFKGIDLNTDIRTADTKFEDENDN